MPRMKSPALAVALALAACAHAPSASPPMDAARSLAAAETAFAAHSVREDMRAAFLANFDADGVFVSQGWTNSNEHLANKPAPNIVLDWRPAFVQASASGDMGLSTGPTKIARKADPGTPPTYGQYVSVWRRNGTGPWKVAVDLGINHEQPLFWDAALEVTVVPQVGPAGTLEGLAAAEAQFTRSSAAHGARSAYSALGSEDLRYYRAPTGPAIGKRASLYAAAQDDPRLAWIVERSEISKAGDFGYARGRYALAGAPGKVLGHYLRVWRMEGGAWRVLLDVANPVPPPKA